MPQDVLLDSSLDLRFVDGDLVVVDGTRQHQQLLLVSEKGEWRENPTIGVGTLSWTLNERPADLNSEIKRQFEKDGMKVVAVQARQAVGSNNFELSIEAEYK